MGRGKPPAAAIPISEGQYRLLSKEKSKRTTFIHYQQRIAILLRASKGESNGQIKREMGLSLNTVKNWRKRWNENYAALLAFEQGRQGQGVSDGELLKAMLTTLKDAPRSDAPPSITLAQKQQIVALACQKPADFGLPVTHWTHQLLAKEAVEQGIVQTLSSRQAGTILENTATPTPQKPSLTGPPF